MASYFARGYSTSTSFLCVEGRKEGKSISSVDIDVDRGEQKSRRPLAASLGCGSQSPALIDADCNFLHADMPPLSTLLSHESTRAANIVAFLSPASTLEESERMLEVLKTFDSSPASPPSPLSSPQIKTTVGVHPYHASEVLSLDSLASKIAECLSNDKLRPHIAAVGETGLDYSEGEKRRGAKQVAGRFVLVR